MAKYVQSCDIKNCYSCHKDKINMEEKQKEIEKQQQENRILQKIQQEKELKAWGEYFGLTLSQARNCLEKKTKKNDEAYQKHMETLRTEEGKKRPT